VPGTTVTSPPTAVASAVTSWPFFCFVEPVPVKVIVNCCVMVHVPQPHAFPNVTSLTLADGGVYMPLHVADVYKQVELAVQCGGSIGRQRPVSHPHVLAPVMPATNTPVPVHATFTQSGHTGDTQIPGTAQSQTLIVCFFTGMAVAVALNMLLAAAHVATSGQ